MYRRYGLNHGNKPLQHLIRRKLLSHSCIELLTGVARDVDGWKAAHGGEDEC